MDLSQPLSHHTGRWSVFEHECIGCGKNLATVCPEPDTPTLRVCSKCLKERMARARHEEHEAAR